MTTEFKIVINNIRTHDVQNFEKVVKQIDFTISGTKQSETFSLPQSLVLTDKQIENFIPFEDLTQAWAVDLIEKTFDNMQQVKSQIEYVLDTMVLKKNLVQQSLPWAPASNAVRPFALF